MTECHQLSDRVITVVHGGTPWTAAESEHLAECADCRRELELVRVTTALGGQLAIDADGTARRLAVRLASPVTVRRFPTRRVFQWAGALAAAAVLVLAVRFEAARRAAPVMTAARDSTIILGELDGLSATELSAVLTEMPSSSREVVMPGGVAGMSDLSADELEQVLDAGEAEQ